MVQVDNPRMMAVKKAAATVPEASDQAETGGQKASEIYENVQVLGHLSAAEFTLTMNAITQWVAPEEGCNYCHVVGADSVNYASDDIYTKVVARRMLQMTQDLNVNWASHVNEEKGVNCWTCHQGNPLPTNYWFYTDRDQPLRHYLDREDLRVQGPAIFAGSNDRSINQTVYAYQLMMNMSNALGVNCTFCHNSARFADWDESSPQRVTALRGLRMVRHTNMEYLVPLQDVWPDNRLGPMGDGPKLECATCHIGAYRPQFNNPASYGVGWNALTQIGMPSMTGGAAEGDEGG